jgi:DNA polymerase-3 subunit delta'
MIDMNWGLLGHEWAVSLLQRHIAQGSVRHAYLFTGPQSVGRRSLALRFAQALNCQQPPAPGEYCGTCRVCRQIAKLQQPDLMIVQAEQVGGTLKVEQIRELRRSLALAPYEARYRVGLLLRFEEAHISAANALLKTLEEPAPQVILLLTAESAESLLPTIVSRCEVVRLRPVAGAPLSEALNRRLGMPEKQSRLLASISAGRPGYAINLYEQPDRMKQRQVWLDEHAGLLKSNLVQRFHVVEKLAKDKDKETVRGLLLVWVSLWRDVLMQAVGVQAAMANLDHGNEVVRLAQMCGIATAQTVVAALERTLWMMDKNVNLRLALEVLMLDLPVVREPVNNPSS